MASRSRSSPRRDRRIALAGALLSAVLIGSTATAALAQEASPSESPSPSPEPSVTPSPSPDPSPTPPPSSGPPPSPRPTKDPTAPPPTSAPGGSTTSQPPRSGQSGDAAGWSPHPGRRHDTMTKAERRAAWRRRIIASWHPSGLWGAYNTDRLDHAAGRLRDKGWHLRRVARQVYAPFIVIGPANWTDTWGAPRFAGGYHPHTGQDVFCREGAPVLAIQNGKVVYSSNGLGGLTAELFREDGGSWYYAHLSAWNKDLASGDPVRTGQVIGFCGHSGDARYSPSHVHFSFHTAAGVALDPMPALVGALRAASTSIGAGERDGGHDLAGNLDPDSALTPASKPEPGIPEAAAVAAPTAAEEPFYPRQLVLLALIPPLAIGLPALRLRRKRRSLLRG